MRPILRPSGVTSAAVGPSSSGTEKSPMKEPQMADTALQRRPTPDRVLLERVALGDERAFGELYDRHHLSLYALAYGIVMDAADAEAVVSEVFDYAWLKAPQPGSIQGSARTWLAG